MGIIKAGERAHLKALYDDDFRYLSLATTQKGTAQVNPGRGVRINYVYYNARTLSDPEVENQQVLVRYDPFDIGTAYAYVKKRWVQLRSEHYLQLRGHSERERELASAELRKQHQNHTREATITAKRLAEFLANLGAHEEVLTQRWHDLEVRDVFARMEGSQMQSLEVFEQEEPVPTLALVGSPSGSQSEQQQETRSRTPYHAEVDEDDVDLSTLEEYEEYH